MTIKLFDFGFKFKRERERERDRERERKKGTKTTVGKTGELNRHKEINEAVYMLHRITVKCSFTV